VLECGSYVVRVDVSWPFLSNGGRASLETCADRGDALGRISLNRAKFLIRSYMRTRLWKVRAWGERAKRGLQCGVRCNRRAPRHALPNPLTWNATAQIEEHVMHILMRENNLFDRLSDEEAEYATKYASLSATWALSPCAGLRAALPCHRLETRRATERPVARRAGTPPSWMTTCKALS
jgi:hypothetical protein